MGEPVLDGRYQLERRLGQGGMGVVFQARHTFLKTSHAIKVIIPDLVGNDPMLATRFRQEALAAAAVRHQNIIAVTDFGVVRGSMPFLVMEFVKGRSLHEIMAEEGPMSPARAWEIISAVAAGVGAAHRQNIVHRDLKPLNIMLQEDVPVAEGLKILDFGLAKIKSGELLGSFVQAQTSGLMGSPFYMAPEQWSDEEPDTRADIYSLGVILYQMLAGEVPFKGTSIPSIMKKHLTLPPPSFQSMGVTVPAAVESVVRHALEKEVESRIDSVPSFLRELHAAVHSGSPVTTTKKQTGPLDPNKTIALELSSTGSQLVDLAATNNPPQISKDTNFGASFDSMAGTVSSAALDDKLKEELSNTAAQLRREKEETEKKQQEENERRRLEELERSHREKSEREAHEREQKEKFDRMAVQARELEDRLQRQTASAPPPATDQGMTHVRQRAVETQVIGPNSIVDHSLARSFPPVDQPPRSNTNSILLAIAGAAVIIVLLAGVGIGGYFIFRPKTVTPVGPTTSTDPPKLTADMKAIEGGKFVMGRDTGPLQETPAHEVTVQPFQMDRTEVTNSEYADFVRETNYTAPSYWGGTKPPSGQESWPVVNVSLEDANAFAAWRSKRDGVTYRLPKEEEWEYAARNGAQSDLYPWGQGWRDDAAVLKGNTALPVGSKATGKNRWGVVDLIGNVWEWTASEVTSYPGNPIKVPASTKDLIAIRGGCFASDPHNPDRPISSAMREFLPPSTKMSLLGFRLVRNAS